MALNTHSTATQTNSTGENSVEQFLSRLLIGFAERNIAVQTIADVVKAQIMDAKLSALVLSVPTTNGVLEVLTSNPGTLGLADAILFLTARKDFPQFLSARATFGLTALALRLLPQLTDRKETLKTNKMIGVLDATIRHLTSAEISVALGQQDRMRIVNALKIIPDDLKLKLFTTVPSLESLKKLCGADNPSASTTLKKSVSVQASSEELLRIITATPDHTLAQKGVTAFRTVGSQQSIEWKAQNIELLLSELENPQLSAFRKGFLAEWFFDGQLREVLHNDAYANTLNTSLQAVLAKQTEDDALLKGAMRALQRDLSLAAMELNRGGEMHPMFLSLMKNASSFFISAFPKAEQDLSGFSKNFANWALQIPVHPEESRLFTRYSWQWMRTLISRQWEDDLKEPPTWVIQLASRFSAGIVSVAPSFWLQEHLHLLVEKLHIDSIQPLFSPTSQHADYVEFICRTLRKKSPSFAARPEMLLALRLLGRTNAHEEGQLAIQETRLRMQSSTQAESSLTAEQQFLAKAFKPDASEDRFGATPVSRALHVLLHTCRTTSQFNDRRPKN
jgi:hypothetical protein